MPCGAGSLLVLDPFKFGDFLTKMNITHLEYCSLGLKALDWQLLHSL